MLLHSVDLQATTVHCNDWTTQPLTTVSQLLIIIYIIKGDMSLCLFVCLLPMVGRTAGPIKTKLGIGTHVDPRSVLVKVNVKVIYLCVWYNRIHDRKHHRKFMSAPPGEQRWNMRPHCELIKPGHETFVHIFAKYWPIFEIISLAYTAEICNNVIIT